MKIEKVTMTQEEVNEAVQEYLKHRYNLSLDVENVSKEYSHHQHYTVEVKAEKVPVATAARAEKTDEGKYIDSLQPDAVRPAPDGQPLLPTDETIQQELEKKHL